MPKPDMAPPVNKKIEILLFMQKASIETCFYQNTLRRGGPFYSGDCYSDIRGFTGFPAYRQDLFSPIPGLPQSDFVD